MLYEMGNGEIHVRNIEDAILQDSSQYLGLFGNGDAEAVIRKLVLNEKPFIEARSNRAMFFENHDGFDFICLHTLNRKMSVRETDKVYIYVRKNLLLFISGDPAGVEKRLREINENQNTPMSFDRFLNTFFERLTADDILYLENIEQEISNLENALITNSKKSCIQEIISLRKRLLSLKRYYEQLLNVLDELLENENDLLGENSIRYFKIYAGKMDRRFHSVLNLRDYVTQVREAYQAEVDISLNNIMKIFTVITAFFSPLTLLVGWYGMNLQIPEFKWVYGYPMVILLSLAIVIFCWALFKQQKWF
jgi:magnesium transporter